MGDEERPTANMMCLRYHGETIGTHGTKARPAENVAEGGELHPIQVE